jgi:formamidopyrimidine-DNA glycosylase
MSPFEQTGSMSDRDLAALHRAAIDGLEEWNTRLRAEVGDGFPEKVAAFRPEMEPPSNPRVEPME